MGEDEAGYSPVMLSCLLLARSKGPRTSLLLVSSHFVGRRRARSFCPLGDGRGQEERGEGWEGAWTDFKSVLEMFPNTGSDCER